MRQSPLANTTAAVALQAMQSQLLAALRDGHSPTEGFRGGLFLDPPSGTAARRWEIYRNAYLIRLVEAIDNDYPAIARITGPTPFHALCHRYLTAFPPHSHDIGRAGQRLAEYLPRDPVTMDLPFLPELARFEWALAEAIGAPDAEPLHWSDLAGLSAEQLADSSLRLSPATVFIPSRWPLAALWLAKDQPDSAVDVPLDVQSSAILVSRQGLEPRWRSIDSDERALVEGASRGATPASLLESGVYGEDDQASLRLVRALRRVADYGALAPLSHSGDAEGAPLSKETP